MGWMIEVVFGGMNNNFSQPYSTAISFSRSLGWPGTLSIKRRPFVPRRAVRSTGQFRSRSDVRSMERSYYEAFVLRGTTVLSTVMKDASLQLSELQQN